MLIAAESLTNTAYWLVLEN